MLIDIKIPVLAESVAEATLADWHKKAGDKVKQGENLVDIETDKVTLEVTALQDGVLVEVLRERNAIVQSEEVIARIETGPTPEPPPLVAENNEDNASYTPKLSPAARHMVEQHKLDIGTIPIQPGRDRISKEDIINTLEQRENQHSTEPGSAAPIPDKETASDQQVTTSHRPEERVPMTSLRKRVAERLLGVQHDNAILTTINEVDMQAVITLRNRYKDEFERTHSVKLGFMSFFTKAVIEALKKFPIINASIDKNDIIYHGYFDVGIAISSPRGLVVPVVRDADLLSLAEIEGKIREYGEKAKKGKLLIDELTGGTFTITNGGVFGSLLSTPIINPPQSAILGMHTIQKRPVVKEDEIVIRPMMYLALSYDHRIIDGSDSVQFLIAIKKQLEDPARLLLQL